MTAAWTTPAGMAYIGLFILSGSVCLAAIPRARTVTDAEIRYGLVGLLATSGLWAVLKTAFFVVPDPLREPTYTIGLVFGFATVFAWLYFASAYTGRRLHTNSTLRWLGAGVFLFVVVIKLTNPLHGLYFTSTEVATPFRHLAIEHGILHWTSTGLAYVLAAVGLFMIFELYLRSEYDTGPLAVLAGLLALPVVFDITAVATPQLLDLIYAPIGVAAFAIGVLYLYTDQFLAVRTAAQSGDITVIVDENDRIQDVSAAAVEVFSELETATGERLVDVLPAVAATRDGDDKIIERHSKGDADSATYYMVSPRSMTLGDSTETVIALTDVTDRERQRRRLIERERELDQRNELYRAVIAASFAFIIRIDLEGRFSFVSPSIEEFLGYDPVDLTGEPISLLAPDEETTAQLDDYVQEVTSGESLQIRDLPLATHTGRTIYVDVRVVPVYEPSVDPDRRTPSDIVGALAMVRDASHRRQREGLISVMNRVLRHNVRNKLTVINGRAEILAETLEGDAKANAEAIAKAGDRLLDLTESARRIESNRDLSPELVTIDVMPIVSETVDQLDARYPDVSVTVEGPETAMTETLPRIETAVWELLENAAEHAGPAPTVRVTVSITDKQTVITVADDGPGLPEDERQVLADGKEEPLVHGQSLGLYLAYWIITNLDGEIRVPKSPSGTTIEVRLPAASTDQ